MLSFTINDLLAQARKIGASDLHVAAGAEAKCRVHGELRKITREPLSAADTAELIMPMVPRWMRRVRRISHTPFREMADSV